MRKANGIALRRNKLQPTTKMGFHPKFRMVSLSSEKDLPLADPLDNKDDRERKYCNAMTV